MNETAHEMALVKAASFEWMLKASVRESPGRARGISYGCLAISFLSGNSATKRAYEAKRFVAQLCRCTVVAAPVYK